MTEETKIVRQVVRSIRKSSKLLSGALTPHNVSEWIDVVQKEFMAVNERLDRKIFYYRLKKANTDKYRQHKHWREA